LSLVAHIEPLEKHDKPKLIDQLLPAVDHAEHIKQKLGDHWLPHIYAHRVLRLRTRPYRFDTSRPARVEIQHTLLGIELKIGSRRLLCPDLATARYLSVFARIGCDEIAIPYDITRISRLADELESSWYRMVLLADEQSRDRSDKFRTRLRGLLFAKIRTEIGAAAGAPRIEEFQQETKQRRGKF
jgi:hypothetical protein